MIATALAAVVGNARTFTSGRHLAAWLGLVPRQRSSGGKGRLLGLSKRGDGCLRRQLMHGARAVVRISPGREGKLWSWIKGLLDRRVFNVVVAAVANKLARILWALLSRGEAYRVTMQAGAARTGSVSTEVLTERLSRAARVSVEDGMNGRTGVGGARDFPRAKSPDE